MGEINVDFKYDAFNTGYKLHIPVVQDQNNPLTSKIIAFLDEKFGLTTQSRYELHSKEPVLQGANQYCTPAYKFGYSDGLKAGETLSIYGKTGTIEELKEVATDIEAKFGKELAQCIKDNGVVFNDTGTRISDNLVQRFAVYDYGYFDDKHCLQRLFTERSNIGNPSGAVIKYLTTDSTGKTCSYIHSHGGPIDLSRLSEIDKKFLYGDCTMSNIDNFGELFTGRINNGKVPQFIMDGLPTEYLKKYNLSEADILARIQKGNVNITALMLRDISQNGTNSTLLRLGAKPLFTNFPIETINEAKELLAQYDKEAVAQLEKLLPQLKQTNPTLSVLEKTKPLSMMKITPIDDLLPGMTMLRNQVQGTLNAGTNISQCMPKVTANTANKSLSWVDDVYANFKTAGAAPVTTPSVVTTVNKQQTLAKQIVDSLTSKGGKTALCITGVSLLALGAISIFNQSKNNNLVASNQIIKRENSCKTNIFKNQGNLTV